ncbi:MAG: rhamnan synthesis F family protein [Candidatus Pristimantibacillus lignocellulolyticus]|uniref:Rhamnan synthesis F family protein n=1 Tax=Candidatus Pristimantibacillus lignocellulolyticus TaxID=2994561 RepID=A0A9J6ZGV9_9BACL|nr:MAG: rhamnan synthesis F family protein [Candidatus Pristimantibacillus lignocellulolyticus]
MILANKEKLNRLGIFFFYDKDGIVDDYITFMLKDMTQNLSDLLVVCNGKLTVEGREKISELTPNILVRENKGFDVWAYKEGMEYYGWDKISKFDEVVLFNSTMFGPLYSFSEMFEGMNSQDLDFWGITKHHEVPHDPFNRIKYGYLPEHIQSHFIVVRNSLLTSYEYKNFWDNMPEIESYEDSIGYYEAVFTKEFNDKGFKWDVYVNTDDLEKHTYHPVLMMPLELVKNRKCPIIKRRSFFHTKIDYLNNTTGEQTSEVYEYIRKNLDYDINLIWDNILRTCHQADIKNALNLSYILSTTSSVQMNTKLNRKIALVMHIYFDDLIEYCLEYATSVPEGTDVYITTDTEHKADLIRTIFEKRNFAKLEIIIIENRGRDISALLVGSKKFIMDYDYVCFAHDKKTKQLEPHIKGESFAYKCFENTLTNQHFVNNVINLFETNPRLGMLSPPPPNHADFYPTIGLEWTINFDNTKALADKLKLSVEMDKNKEPIAPLGTMFWFRPKALKALFDYDWEYKDFPPEPNDTDGTLLHAIERIYPFVSQHEGYYPALLLSDSFAKIEVTNLYFMLREINTAYMMNSGPAIHLSMVSVLKYNMTYKIPFKYKLKMLIKKILPVWLFNLLKRLIKRR